MANSGDIEDDSNLSNQSVCGDSFDDQDSEDSILLLKRLDELKRNCFEKNVEKVVLERCNQSIRVARFLNAVSSDDFLPDREIRYLKKLLDEKEDISKHACELTKENRELEREIINKRLRLKVLMLKRRKLWNEAVKIYRHTSLNFSGFDSSDASDDFCDDILSDKQKAKEYKIRNLNNAVAAKAFGVSQLSRIVYNLITFSGVSWATDKRLLQIILCTGKILERDYDIIKNYKVLRKTVDDTIHQLNRVRI